MKKALFGCRYGFEDIACSRLGGNQHVLVFIMGLITVAGAGVICNLL